MPINEIIKIVNRQNELILKKNACSNKLNGNTLMNHVLFYKKRIGSTRFINCHSQFKIYEDGTNDMHIKRLIKIRCIEMSNKLCIRYHII